MSKLATVAKRTITALYWEFCFKEDDYLETLAILHVDPDKPDDVVIAEVDQALSNMGRKLFRATRVKPHA